MSLLSAHELALIFLAWGALWVSVLLAQLVRCAMQ